MKRLSESLSVACRFGARFPRSVRSTLSDAGWHEGRRWDSERLEEFTAKFDTVFPPVAVRVLSEFGGLNIGFGGRLIFFGYIDEHLCSSLNVVRRLVGKPLFPVARTNIFEDDGLGVFMDESGRIYVDGATGCEPPRDYRCDLIEDDIDQFLIKIFSPGRTPERQSWYYSISDLEEGSAMNKEGEQGGDGDAEEAV